MKMPISVRIRARVRTKVSVRVMARVRAKVSVRVGARVRAMVRFSPQVSIRMLLRRLLKRVYGWLPGASQHLQSGLGLRLGLGCSDGCPGPVSTSNQG